MDDKSNHRQTLVSSTAILLGLLVLAATVFGETHGSEPSQTWPSRTPTSAGALPTPTPPGPGPGGTSVPVESTPSPPATGQVPATAFPPAGSSPGPGVAPGGPTNGTTGNRLTRVIESHLPSAANLGACDIPPLALALGTVNVRSGPGVERSIVGALEFQEARLIIGRDGFAPWWMILLDSGRTGWVSDEAVSVVGYMGAVPVIADAAGATEGQPPWNPTPNPLCTPLAEDAVQATVASIAGSIASSDEAAATPSLAVLSDSGAAVADGESSQLATGSSQIETLDSSPGTNLLWIPAAGLALILAGVILLVLQRRQY